MAYRLAAELEFHAYQEAMCMIPAYNLLPELSDTKVDATNAPPEPTLKHAKMIILLVRIRLFLLASQSLKNRVCTNILHLKLKRYIAGIESDFEVNL